MKLETYMAESGLTIAEFARLAGVDQSTINRLCKGGQIPTRAVMAKIVELTGGVVTANDFFGIGGGGV